MKPVQFLRLKKLTLKQNFVPVMESLEETKGEDLSKS